MVSRSSRSPFRHPWYAYAFLTDALLANLVLVVARIGASLVPLWGPVLHFFVWLGVYVYAFECLHASAHGHPEPPVLRGVLQTPALRGHVRLQALVLIGLALLLNFVGTGAATLWIALLALWLPAAALSMFATDSAWAGLDPRNWLATLGVVGPGYAVLAAASALVLAVQTFAGAWLPLGLGYVPAVAVYYLLAHALVLTLFHLLGRCAHQFHQRFDYLMDSPELPPNRMRSDEERQLDAIERRFAAGETDVARAELAAAAASGGPAIQRRYRIQLARDGDRRGLIEHARRFIAQLMVLKQEREALALVADCLRDAPDFLPIELDDTARLVALALRLGLRDTALAIARNACERFPRRQQPFDIVDAALADPGLVGDDLRRPWEALSRSRPANAPTVLAAKP